MVHPSVQEDGWALMEAVKRHDVQAVRRILALAHQGVAGAAAATANTALTETTAQIEARLEQQALTNGHTARCGQGPRTNSTSRGCINRV